MIRICILCPIVLAVSVVSVAIGSDNDVGSKLITPVEKPTNTSETFICHDLCLGSNQASRSELTDINSSDCTPEDVELDNEPFSSLDSELFTLPVMLRLEDSLQHRYYSDSVVKK